MLVAFTQNFNHPLQNSNMNSAEAQRIADLYFPDENTSFTRSPPPPYTRNIELKPLAPDNQMTGHPPLVTENNMTNRPSPKMSTGTGWMNIGNGISTAAWGFGTLLGGIGSIIDVFQKDSRERMRIDNDFKIQSQQVANQTRSIDYSMKMNDQEWNAARAAGFASPTMAAAFYQTGRLRGPTISNGYTADSRVNLGAFSAQS
jgi:hypothetical protein